MALKYNEIIKTGGVSLSTTYRVNQPYILLERIACVLEIEKHQTVRTYSSTFPVLLKLR